jgi:hypothetical protein
MITELKRGQGCEWDGRAIVKKNNSDKVQVYNDVVQQLQDNVYLSADRTMEFFSGRAACFREGGAGSWKFPYQLTLQLFRVIFVDRSRWNNIFSNF